MSHHCFSMAGTYLRRNNTDGTPNESNQKANATDNLPLVFSTFLPLDTLQHVANTGDDTKNKCLQKRAEIWKR